MNLKLLMCIKQWLCMSLYCLKRSQVLPCLIFIEMLHVAKVVPFVYHCDKIKILPFPKVFNMMVLGCVSNSTNSCTTIRLRTSVFSCLSDISKYLYYRQLFVNMGEDRGCLLFLDGTACRHIFNT